MYNLVLKNGRVIDPGQSINRVTDVAFSDGKVAAVGDDLSGRETLDCSGEIVTPGLIDLHTHVYWGGSALGVDPIAYAKSSAVATLVDTGSAGPGNFDGFRAQIIDPCPIRILAYLHVSIAGVFSFSKEVMVGESEDIRLMSPRESVRVARENPDVIIGIKIRLGKHASGDQGMTTFEYALDVAEETGLPIMAHIDEAPPTYEQLCARLRPGDVLTHAFRPFPNSPALPGGGVRAAVLEARERGVVFDIGHGMGSFGWQTARTMMHAGFAPDVISSDVHKLCINGPAVDQLTTMSKFLHLGMELDDVIAASTTAPAKALRRPDIASFAVGSPGDASVIGIEDGSFPLTDAAGETEYAKQRLSARALVLSGKVFSKAGG